MRVTDKVLFKQGTSTTVGPGSYEISKDIDRKIYNPTIPREGVSSNYHATSGRRRNNGTIKDNYDVDS